MLLMVNDNQKSYHFLKTTNLLSLVLLLKLTLCSLATEIDHPKKASNCDIVLYSSTSKNGTIQSPMYPGTYPAKTFCRYEFQGKGKERIQISFSEFSLPADGDYECEEADTLQIFVPMRGKYEVVETLCGETMPKPIMSTGPKMLLEFRGTQGGKGNRGFKADYTFLENFGIISGRQLTDHPCSFAYNSSEAMSGWLHSPNFPGAYPRNIECHYLFYGSPLDKVMIRFTYFDVEGIFPCGGNSASDYVEFSNFLTEDRKFRKYCGEIRDFSVKSDGRFFRVTFRSNDRLDGTGFRAFYAFETEKVTTEIIPEVIKSIAGKIRLNNLRHSIGIAVICLILRIINRNIFML